MVLFLCHREDLVTLMRESSFLSHKCSAVDAHAAMGDFTTKRYCGGAQSELRPSKIEGMRELKLSLIHIFSALRVFQSGGDSVSGLGDGTHQGQDRQLWIYGKNYGAVASYRGTRGHK